MLHLTYELLFPAKYSQVSTKVEGLLDQNTCEMD